jgi:hypothetical protein
MKQIISQQASKQASKQGFRSPTSSSAVVMQGLAIQGIVYDNCAVK